MRRAGGGRARTIGLGVLAAVVVVLALAQLILPRVAQSTVSARVGRYGKVLSVHVSAWPAVELLWGHVDSVRVRAATLKLTPAQAASLLWESRDVASMDVQAQAVELGSLRVTGATLSKRGAQLSASAQASGADVNAALPQGISLKLLRSEAGAVEVQSSGGLFGVGSGVDAVASASEGKLVARPRGLLASAFQLTLFSDRHVHVEGVAASVARAEPLSYRLTMSALLG
jgi:hypothetical protein